MKAKTRIRKLLLLACGICLIMSMDTSYAAGLLIADGGFGGRLTIEEQTVNVTINNSVAVTEVTQVFKNQENRQVEALYTFPVPKGASVSNFSMWINDKEMIGEVLEKKRARQIYDSYKRKRRDPGLLEQKDYKTFEMRIFPINAKARQKVKITYYQELDVDHDWATYVYPLATATKNFTSSKTEGKFATNLNVKSEIPIVKLESPSHAGDFVIAKHSDHYFQASLESKEGDLNRDVVLAYHLQRPQSGLDIITSKHSGEDGYFALQLTAGKELAEMNKGMDFVFILDISGSMNNDGKMRISRNSIDAFVSELGNEDKFEIITFNVQPKTLFNSLTDVNKATREKAVQFLKSQRARGGTDLRPAVNAAYKYNNPDRQQNIVILSDGMTEQGTKDELIGIIRSRPRNTRVFCIGVGNEVNRPLLTQLAEDAGGLASFISRGDNFTRQAKAFRRKLMRPAISNLKIDFSKLVYDVEPKQLPNLFHGQPVRIYGRYKGDGDVKISLQGDIGSREYKKSATVSFPQIDETNPEIERMWAWHKIQRLLKNIDNLGDRNRVIDEIVRLGEAYSIVTQYTSFLVLENDTEYRRWKIARRNALRIQTDRKSRELVKAQFEQIRKKAATDIGPNVAQKAVRTVQRPTVNQVVNSVPATRAPSVPVVRTSSPRPSRSVDLGLPRMGGGGGAIDPITAILTVIGGVAAYGLLKPRKNRHNK